MQQTGGTGNVKSAVPEGKLAVCTQVLVEEGVAEKFIGLDMSDAETVFQRCLDSINLVREVGSGGKSVLVSP